MPSNFPWLKIKGMKIDSKNRQQNKCPDNFETVLIFKIHVALNTEPDPFGSCPKHNQMAQSELVTLIYGLDKVLR